MKGMGFSNEVNSPYVKKLRASIKKQVDRGLISRSYGTWAGSPSDAMATGKIGDAAVDVSGDPIYGHPRSREPQFMPESEFLIGEYRPSDDEPSRS